LQREHLAPLVRGSGSATSTPELLKKLLFRVDAILKVKQGDAAPDEQSREALASIVDGSKGVLAALEALEKKIADTVGGLALGEVGYEEVYAQRMLKYSFAYRDIVNDPAHSFKYREELASDRESSPARQKALLRELTGNLMELPICFNTSTLVRADENTQHALQFLVLAGKEGGGSPYDGGCFLFDLYCPPNYPQVPPKTWLMTTGGGTVRFNPNLYDSGYVCLTVLNAKGAGGETWRPNDSNNFEVIMAIQSFVLNKMYPLFNEPGEQSKFQHDKTDSDTKRRCRTAHWSGSQFGETGYQAVREGTVEHAMIAQLRHPPEGFEDPVKEHFSLKGPYIVRQIEGWIEDAARFDDTDTHKKKLQVLLEEFKEELKKLHETGTYKDGTPVGPPLKAVQEAEYTYQQYPF